MESKQKHLMNASSHFGHVFTPYLLSRSQLRSLAAKAAAVSVILQESAHWCSLLCARVRVSLWWESGSQTRGFNYTVLVLFRSSCSGVDLSFSFSAHLCVSAGSRWAPRSPRTPWKERTTGKTQRSHASAMVVCRGVNPVSLCSCSIRLSRGSWIFLLKWAVLSGSNVYIQLFHLKRTYYWTYTWAW